MRLDLVARHSAAVGAIVGLAVGESLARTAEVPPTLCGHRTDFLAPWGPITERAFATAEAALKMQPIDIDVSPAEIVPTAIRLADDDAGPPLLVDPDAATVCELIRDALIGRLDAAGAGAVNATLDSALQSVTSAEGFADAVLSCTRAGTNEALALTGALAGATWGPASIPAAWTTYLRGPVGANTYRPRQLRRLAERLLRLDAPTPPEPRWRLGPTEVAAKLWLSNLPAVARFVANHPDGAVISLCPTTGAFDGHPRRREFVIHDQSGRHINPHLTAQVDEVLATIDAFHADDRDVLVHCHHGASRTGLVLRAWLMRNDGLTLEDATAEAQARWSKTSTWNTSFAKELRRRESAGRP